LFSRAAWARILPFATYMAFIAITDLLARLGWSPAELRWLYGVKVAAVVLVLGVTRGAGWRTLGAAAGFDPTTAGRTDWPLGAMRIAGAALVVPVMEELFWRSFAMRWIDTPAFDTVEPSQVSIKSAILTSVLFGLEHNLWLAGVVAGLAYSALYMRHRTIWSPILAHAVTNCLLGIWVVVTGSWSYW
jgi:CAAX prenyl protease-like protein